MKVKIILLSFIFQTILSVPYAISSEKIHTLTCDNKSGYNAVVRVFYDGTERRVAEVAVPKDKIKGAKLANGRYYIVAKYGPTNSKKDHKEYFYSKGDPFDLKSPAAQYIEATITLHKVVNGNYRTEPVDASAFGE